MTIRDVMPSYDGGPQSEFEAAHDVPEDWLEADWRIRPKHKHIVLPSWVEECLDEETLMNEDGEWHSICPSHQVVSHADCVGHKPR